MHDKYKKMLHELNTMESLIESKATEARAVSMERERTMLQQEAELHILQQQMEAMQGESKEREDKLLRNPTLNNTKRDNESMDVDAKGNVSTVKIPRIEMDPITNERMSMYEREMSNKRFECMRQEYLSLRRQSKRETDALTVTAAQAQEALSVNISGKTHNSPDQRESEQGAVRNSSNTDRNSRKRRSDSMKMARKILRSLRPWVGIQIIAGPKDGVKVHFTRTYMFEHTYAFAYAYVHKDIFSDDR